MVSLTDAQRLKFRLLAEGMAISPAARLRLDELRGERDLTPADYASTTGLILRLEDEVWVNAPIADHNPSLVVTPRTGLEVISDSFVLCGGDLESAAKVCLPPLYHGRKLSTGRPANHFAFTHADRVRLAPIGGCTMRCKFCNIPYEDPYETKSVDDMIEVLELAFTDPLQPARHVMISGGTPSPRDVPYLRTVYERILGAYPHRHVDIMMVPVPGLLDLPRLKDLGLHELSINVELFNAEIARTLMPQKSGHGLRAYLDCIREAVRILGPGKVRSMLLVGLEAPADTMQGVREILEAGAIPVLSPFRPSMSTPLRDVTTMSASAYEEFFLGATELAQSAGLHLGPSCPPCTHNTLTLSAEDAMSCLPNQLLPVLV